MFHLLSMLEEKGTLRIRMTYLPNTLGAPVVLFYHAKNVIF
jgi:hypothetical protein